MKKNIPDYYHRIAMDFSFQAKQAEAKDGNFVLSKYLMEQAAFFGKKAALLAYNQKEASIEKNVFLRSAGWMAVKAKLYKDAQFLAKLGLSGKSNEIETEYFEEILNEIQDKVDEKDFDFTNSELHFYGTVANLNLDEKKLFIRENGGDNYREIVMPEDFDKEIIGQLFGDFVEIQAKKEKNETIVLEHIQLAA